MKISSSFLLNCSSYKIKRNSYNFRIQNLDENNQDLTFKIFNQSDVLFNDNLADWIPFIRDKVSVANAFNNGIAIYCSLSNEFEFLKLWVPPNPDWGIISLYGSDSKLRSLITLDEDELAYHSVITFCRPALNNTSDETLSKLHVNEMKPHNDIFIGHNFKSNKLGLKKNYKTKLSVNAGVHGSTYIDRNGHLQYLGNYYGR